MAIVLSPEFVAAVASVDAGYRLISGRSFGQRYVEAVAVVRADGRFSADDVRALLVGSALLIAANKGATDKDGPGGPTNARAAAALLAGWREIAKREGYHDGDTAPAPSSQGANLIVIAIVGILAQAAVFAWLIYQAAKLAEHMIAGDRAERELVRLHTRVAEILEGHKDGRAWTPEELQELAALESQIDAMQRGLAPPAAPSYEPEAFGAGTLVGGVAVIAAIYYLFLRPRRA